MGQGLSPLLGNDAQSGMSARPWEAHHLPTLHKPPESERCALHPPASRPPVPGCRRMIPKGCHPLARGAKRPRAQR